MDFRFDGKTALVTGAGKGIGRGIAMKLVQLGAKVIALSRTQEDLDSLKQEVPSIEIHAVDLRDWEATRSLVQGLGPVDLLVNNAGNNILRPFLDVSKEDLDSQFNVNYMAPYNISQVVAKGMVERKSGGAIVMISSVMGLRAGEKRTVYCSSKAALDQLTRCLAMELGPHKIRVNSVNPTVVMTTLARRAGWGNAEQAAPVLNRIPVGHFAGLFGSREKLLLANSGDPEQTPHYLVIYGKDNGVSPATKGISFRKKNGVKYTKYIYSLLDDMKTFS